MQDTEEFEVEYLDEDAEVVQQCLESVVTVDKTPINQSDEVSKTQNNDKKLYVDDDYKPKSIKPAKRGRKPGFSKPENISKPVVNDEKLKDFSNRKIILEAKIYDYEDPTCLPIPADTETSKYREQYQRWQKTCLWQITKSNPPKEFTGTPTKTIMQLTLKKETLNSNHEIHVSQKMSISSISGQKWVDNYQGILPKFIKNDEAFKPHKILAGTAKKSTNKEVFTTLLRTTEIEGSKVLIAYKTDESVTNVFKLFDDEKKENIKFLQGISSIRCCALCHHYSYRGPKQSNIVPQDCVICGRTFTTAYNMLSHIRSHPKDVKREKKVLISRSLSKFMPYHYKCQICIKKLPTIRHMRLHLKNHHSIGSPKFCEVGDHWTL